MKKNVKNLPEFKALIERYRIITLEEIEETANCDDYVGRDNKHILTGFGSYTYCTLCIAVGTTNIYSNCKFCVYPGKEEGCLKHKTYDAIESAKTPEELLTAYRARAEYMETLLK